MSCEPVVVYPHRRMVLSDSTIGVAAARPLRSLMRLEIVEIQADCGLEVSVVSAGGCLLELLLARLHQQDCSLRLLVDCWLSIDPSRRVALATENSSSAAKGSKASLATAGYISCWSEVLHKAAYRVSGGCWAATSSQSWWSIDAC